MKVAFVGCGFVAALYLKALRLRTSLELVGVMDRVAERAERLGRHAGVPVFGSLSELLERSGASIIVNLTNPDAHYAINRRALEAGKHVYCEKPLAMRVDQAVELVELARRLGLHLSGAPSNVLGEAAQGAWRALRMGAIGTPRLVYAELDDGMIHRAPYRSWTNELGVPWPYKDEFEVGCTLEHAGYYLTWLAAFFGPATHVTRFAAVSIPDKGTPEPLTVQAPDVSVACLRFRSGVVARLTCSIVAPHDHRMRIMGEEGVMTVHDCWDYRSKVTIQKTFKLRRRLVVSPWRSRVALPPAPIRGVERFGAASMDFASGIAELAEAIRANRPSRLSPEFCLHITELALAIHGGDENPNTIALTSTFDTLSPMPWAHQ